MRWGGGRWGVGGVRGRDKAPIHVCSIITVVCLVLCLMCLDLDSKLQVISFSDRNCFHCVCGFSILPV